MSDNPQGPDWWLASDGRWYPPELRAAADQAAPPPPRPISSDVQLTPDWWLASDGRWYPPSGPLIQQGNAPSVSRGLGGTLQGFLWAAGALSIITAIAAVNGAVRYYEWRDARGFGSRARAFDDMLDADDAIAAFLVLHWMVSLVVFILMIVWLNQAHRVSETMWRGPRSWSSGWTIGCWFIPLAFFVIPKLVFTEIERMFRAPRQTDGSIPDGWQSRSPWTVGIFWWLAFVSGVVVTTAGVSMNDSSDSDVWEAAYWLLLGGQLLLAASAVLCVLYLRRLVRSLTGAATV